MNKKDFFVEIKMRRTYMRLPGHGKRQTYMKCHCGEVMERVPASIKKNGWTCRKEENAWDNIFTLLGIK